MKGRFGPYVTDGTTNATVPNSEDPTSTTLEHAITLLADRAAKGGGRKKASRPKKEAKPANIEKSATSSKKKPAKATKKKPEPVAGE
jgi:DNA topoisomerase-1